MPRESIAERKESARHEWQDHEQFRAFLRVVAVHLGLTELQLMDEVLADLAMERPKVRERPPR